MLSLLYLRIKAQQYYVMDDNPPPPARFLSQGLDPALLLFILSLFYHDINVKYTVFFSLEAPTFFNFYFLPQDNSILYSLNH